MAATLPRGIEEGIAPFKFSRMCGKMPVMKNLKYII